MLLSILIFSTFSLLSHGLVMPPYMKACKANDPELNKCALKNANEAIPFLLKGDAKYKIPHMVPFKINRVEVDGGTNFKLKMEDIEIWGIDTAKVTMFDLNPTKKELKIDISSDLINVYGTYDINGRILVLPLNGRGPANITLHHPLLHYKQTWDLVQKNGETYAVIKDSDITYDVEKVVYDFRNLFNGNEQLGKETNKVLNENWNAVHNDFSGPVAKSMLAVINNILGNVYGLIPYKYIFLE